MARFHISHSELVRIALRRARKARLVLNETASLDALLELDSAAAALHRLRFGELRHAVSTSPGWLV